MEHLDVFTVVKNLMLYSTSPIGRREVKNLYTDNPFDVNVEITEEARNRNVEILNAYLKTMGLRIVFRQIPKMLINPITINPIKFINREKALIDPLVWLDKQEQQVTHVAEVIRDEDGLIIPITINPIKYLS